LRTDAAAQASVLGLYDPDRSQAVSTWARFDWSALVDALSAAKGRLAERRGAGLRILERADDSPRWPTNARALGRAPRARWHQFMPVHRDHARARRSRRLARTCQPVYRFGSGGCDPVARRRFFWPRGRPPCATAHDFMARRDAGDRKLRSIAVHGRDGVIADWRGRPITAWRSSQRHSTNWRYVLAGMLGAAGYGRPASAISSDLEHWLTQVTDDLSAAGRAAWSCAADHLPHPFKSPCTRSTLI